MIINKRNIKMWSTIGPRATFGVVALELAKEIENLMILTCDVSTSAGLDRYRKTFPEKYLDLGIAEYLMVIMTATLASVGTAGVPGVGLIMLAMVLQQVGLPVEGIGLIIGVDRLLDMTRTAVNVTGDAMVSTVVARSEGDFDEEVYYDENAGKKLEEL